MVLFTFESKHFQERLGFCFFPEERKQRRTSHWNNLLLEIIEQTRNRTKSDFQGSAFVTTKLPLLVVK